MFSYGYIIQIFMIKRRVVHIVQRVSSSAIVRTIHIKKPRSLSELATTPLALSCFVGTLYDKNIFVNHHYLRQVHFDHDISGFSMSAIGDVTTCRHFWVSHVGRQELVISRIFLLGGKTHLCLEVPEQRPSPGEHPCSAWRAGVRATTTVCR